MVKKKIKFNYFEPNLVDGNGEVVGRWDPEGLLNFLASDKNGMINKSVDLGDYEKSDFEVDTISYSKVDHIYSFQLSKNRSINIPAIKKLGEQRKNISLNDDQYIGEFNTVIYDQSNGCIITQSNFFGLTTRQVENVLNVLRINYLLFLEEDIKDISVISLDPLIDNQAIEKVENSDYIRTIEIKGADFSRDANLDIENDEINRINELVGEVSGYKFKLEISVQPYDKKDSLEKDRISEMIKWVTENSEHVNEESGSYNVEMSVKTKYDELSRVETIDLLEPRLTSQITIEVPQRNSISHKEIYRSFLSQNYLNDEWDFRARVNRIMTSVE